MTEHLFHGPKLTALQLVPQLQNHRMQYQGVHFIVFYMHLSYTGIHSSEVVLCLKHQLLVFIFSVITAVRFQNPLDNPKSYETEFTVCPDE